MLMITSVSLTASICDVNEKANILGCLSFNVRVFA